MGFGTQKLGQKWRFWELCKNRAENYVFLKNFKKHPRKRTLRAPENMCKTCIFISENAFYISMTYDHFVKNADITKLWWWWKFKHGYNLDFRPKPPHASLKNTLFKACMRGFWPKVEIVAVFEFSSPHFMPKLAILHVTALLHVTSGWYLGHF